MKKLDKKKWIILIVVLTFAFSGCSSLERLQDHGVEGFIGDILEDTFAAYQEFGLTFDLETRNLYYQDERVIFFEDRTGILSRVSHGDSGASGIHVHTLRDSDGDLSGLEAIRR